MASTSASSPVSESTRITSPISMICPWPNSGCAAFLPFHLAGFQLDAFEQHVVEAVDVAVADHDVAELGLHHALDRRLPQRLGREVGRPHRARIASSDAADAVALRQEQPVAFERHRLRAGCVAIVLVRPRMFPQHFAVARAVGRDPAFVDDDDLPLAGERRPTPARRSWPAACRRSSGRRRCRCRRRRARSCTPTCVAARRPRRLARRR